MAWPYWPGLYQRYAVTAPWKLSLLSIWLLGEFRCRPLVRPESNFHNLRHICQMRPDTSKTTALSRNSSRDYRSQQR